MQIFRNVPASKFAHPPDRSYRCEYPPQGSRGFYIRAHRALLPPHAPDMLTVRIQAIDGTGTFTLPDFQPCRLLTLLRGHYTHFIATTRRSAPLRRIGTFGLAVGAACAFPLPSPARFSRSVPKPGRASRRLHAGCRSGSIRTSSELIPEAVPTPGFDIV